MVVVSGVHRQRTERLRFSFTLLQKNTLPADKESQWDVCPRLVEAPLFRDRCTSDQTETLSADKVLRL